MTFVLYFFSIIAFASLPLLANTHEFFKSFIKSYDLSGRYSHEYHPFILQKTAHSFLELEKALKKDFSLDGRMLIIGYQEEALPPYTTDWERHFINDEVKVCSQVGIAQPAKNIFGCMTGFLLHDAEWMIKSWQKAQKHVKTAEHKKPHERNKQKQIPVMHCAAHPIELFNPKAHFLQKHAFGKDYPLLIQARDEVEKALYRADIKQVMTALINFWSMLYEQASKTGSQEVISAQDILFSISYARALVEGNTAIKKVFCGPDITYPIEVLTIQNAHVTDHAQVFIEKFIRHVKPVHKQKTAYIFCSYVDGVGKSTLLNNIKNYQKYGKDVVRYERCDNSSSQRASLYALNDQVTLVDLPAQVSHFTIKPDGSVFVPLETVKERLALKNELTAYVQERKQELIESFKHLCDKYARFLACASKEKGDLGRRSKQMTETVGECNQRLEGNDKTINADNLRSICDDETINEELALNDACAHLAYNTMLFKEKGIDSYCLQWIPFCYNDHYYLFKNEDTKNKGAAQHNYELRTLVSLENVHSIGLKVVEPHAMLFDKGIALPLPYDDFLLDLTDQLKQAGVERIIFVDFLSMYPRTSRENIRVNFMLQQLKKAYGNAYSIKQSPYRTSIHTEQEICALLERNFEQLLDNMLNESMMRFAFTTILESEVSRCSHELRGAKLNQTIQEFTHVCAQQHMQTISEVLRKRLHVERKLYRERYALDRIYETIITFSAEPVIAFSNALMQLLSKNGNPFVSSLWKNTLNVVNERLHSRSNQNQIEVKASMPVECKDEETMKEWARLVRAHWYLSLSCLLQREKNDELCLNAPIIVEKHHEQLQALSVKYDAQFNAAIPDAFASLFQLKNAPVARWVRFDNQTSSAFLVHFPIISTHSGVYAFGYEPLKSEKNCITKLLESYRIEKVKLNEASKGISATDFYQLLAEYDMFKRLEQEFKKNKLAITPVSEEQKSAVRLFIRCIATLEMILKDPESFILVRKGNKSDFVGAIKLLEKITLPLYFGFKSDEPLFDDYSTIEPVISWEIITR